MSHQDDAPEAPLHVGEGFAIVKVPMNDLAKHRLPSLADFPAGTEFWIFQHDWPMTYIPVHGWIDWIDGTPRWGDTRKFREDNNWPADSFEQWIELVKAARARRGD